MPPTDSALPSTLNPSRQPTVPIRNANTGAFTMAFQVILVATDKLEAFASFYGPDFYGLPRNNSTITLEKSEQTIPESYPMADGSVVPLMAGKTIPWTLKPDNA